jgi:hypothetical protein
MAKSRAEATDASVIKLRKHQNSKLVIGISYYLFKPKVKEKIKGE